MSENYLDMSFVQVTKLPGVGDLPILARGKFAKALIAEARGEHATAAEFLAAAVEAEAEVMGR